jgi:serine protease DegQ
MFRNVIALRPVSIAFCAMLAFAGRPSAAIGQAVPGFAGELPTLIPILEQVTPVVINISRSGKPAQRAL